MIEQSKVLYSGFHKILEVESEIKDKKVKREKLIIKNGVAGLVIDEDGRIALVTQYRPVIERKIKELPAGLLDKEGLTPIEILIEELMEECEIPKEDILHVEKMPFHEYFMIVGSSDATISIYEVRVKNQTNRIVQDTDVESVEWVDFETFSQYVREGFIVDGKTLVSYYYLLNQIQNGNSVS